MCIIYFSSGNYVIGKGDKMEISAIIDNKGEDAFNAMLYLQVTKSQRDLINSIWTLIR